jgi:cyclophilin family peptidyl-prolyl cis-trans isomerase
MLISLFSMILASSALSLAETPAETESEAVAEEAAEEVAAEPNPMVRLETNYGNIDVELYQKEAPISVDNFLTYVKDGFYDGTIIHRVVSGFVLQAGGMNEEMKEKIQRPAIKNEATNGLSNLKGTLSMARTSAINSGTSHFFINLRNNTQLDHKGDAPAQYGYAVFGRVAGGMDVVEKIAEVEVADKGRHKNVPVKPVSIKNAYVLKAEAAEEEAAEEDAKKVEEKKAEHKKVKED